MLRGILGLGTVRIGVGVRLWLRLRHRLRLRPRLRPRVKVRLTCRASLICKLGLGLSWRLYAAERCCCRLGQYQADVLQGRVRLPVGLIRRRQGTVTHPQATPTPVSLTGIYRKRMPDGHAS